MQLTEIIEGAREEAAKNAKHIERLTAQLQADLTAGRFPATNHLRDLASYRIQRDLWTTAHNQLQRLEADAHPVKAGQILRQIADSALKNLLFASESSDGFDRAQRTAERDGFSRFYQDATTAAEYVEK
jgi:phosphopentomutase